MADPPPPRLTSTLVGRSPHLPRHRPERRPGVAPPRRSASRGCIPGVGREEARLRRRGRSIRGRRRRVRRRRRGMRHGRRRRQPNGRMQARHAPSACHTTPRRRADGALSLGPASPVRVPTAEPRAESDRAHRPPLGLPPRPPPPILHRLRARTLDVRLERLDAPPHSASTPGAPHRAPPRHPAAFAPPRPARARRPTARDPASPTPTSPINLVSVHPPGGTWLAPNGAAQHAWRAPPPPPPLAARRSPLQGSVQRIVAHGLEHPTAFAARADSARRARRRRREHTAHPKRRRRHGGGRAPFHAAWMTVVAWCQWSSRRTPRHQRRAVEPTKPA